jgi:hypothetical protein
LTVVPPAASLNIPTICSSLNLLFFICSGPFYEAETTFSIRPVQGGQVNSPDALTQSEEPHLGDIGERRSFMIQSA